MAQGDATSPDAHLDGVTNVIVPVTGIDATPSFPEPLVTREISLALARLPPCVNRRPMRSSTSSGATCSERSGSSPPPGLLTHDRPPLHCLTGLAKPVDIIACAVLLVALFPEACLRRSAAPQASNNRWERMIMDVFLSSPEAVAGGRGPLRSSDLPLELEDGRFIFGERNGIYIIDLQQTLSRIETGTRSYVTVATAAPSCSSVRRSRRRTRSVRMRRSAVCPTSTSAGSAAHQLRTIALQKMQGAGDG
jgi:hypothetical protein